MHAPLLRSALRRGITTPYLLVAAFFLPQTALLAQSTWSLEPNRELSGNRALAYDSVRNVTVMVGGGNGHPFVYTREWDGNTWTRRATARSPRARRQATLTYQSGPNTMLLFGGYLSAGMPLDETWEYNGVDWTERRPAVVPPARLQPGLAWDPARNRTVMFGGYDGSGAFMNDTWEWDGNNWMQLQPAISPPQSLADSELCFDEVTQRILLVMTNPGNTNPTRETWSWDGVAWTQLGTDSLPNLNHASIGVVYDTVARQPLLLSETTNPNIMEVLRWDGQTWSGTSSATPSTNGIRSKPAFDIQRGVLVHYAAKRLTTWELSGNVWTNRETFTDLPQRSAFGTFDPQRQGVVFVDWPDFSGTMRLLEQSPTGGFRLVLQQSVNAPPQPNGIEEPLVFDEASGRLLLFTHDVLAAVQDEVQVWEFDGNQWSERVPLTTRPPARKSFALAHDGRRWVMFGGFRSAAGGWINDMWTWDGADWTQLTPGVLPPPRGRSTMVRDLLRDRLVLFGGQTNFVLGGQLNDTWEWDGTRWTQAQPTNAPSLRYLHCSAFDPERGRVMIHSGRNTQILGETWEWTGSDWVPLATGSTTPTARIGAAAFYDASVGAVRMFGGVATGTWVTGTRGGLWTLRTDDPGLADSFGTGCPGGQGVPELITTGNAAPWLGEPFALAATNLAPGTSATLLLGLSNTRWGTTPLPLDLTPFGGRGCTLLVEPAAVVPTVQGQITFTVPSAAALLNLQLYAQTILFDAAAPNPAGLALTPGLALTIGRR